MWDQLMQWLGINGTPSDQVMKTGGMGAGEGTRSASSTSGSSPLTPQMLGMLMQQLQQPTQHVGFAPAGSPVRPTAFNYTPPVMPQTQPNPYRPLGS